MRIIPAIDIIDGKCVRLSQGDYSRKKIYNEDPLEVALEFEDNGLKYLHLVDLDGARSKHIVNYKTLEKIAAKTKLQIDFGGGIKSENDLRIAFESGAQQVTGGSIAAKNPEEFLAWLSAYGNQKIILGADAQNQKIATQGWKETSEIVLLDYLSGYVEKGIAYTVCTDIAKDGMLQGPAIDLYHKILSRVNVNLIASGGVSSMEDLYKLKEIGCEGSIVGKAIYEGKISLKNLQSLC